MVIDLASGLTLAKGVVDLAKGLQDLSNTSNNLEIREAAAELRSKTLDLKETVNGMRDTIVQLKEQLEFKKELNWNGQTFDYIKDGKRAYICNGCETKNKYVHMTERKKRMATTQSLAQFVKIM